MLVCVSSALRAGVGDAEPGAYWYCVTVRLPAVAGARELYGA